MIFNQEGWPAPYAVAHRLVFDTYYERGALEPLAAYYARQFEPVPPRLLEFIPLAIRSERSDLAKKVRLGVLAESKRRFFEWLPDRERYGHLDAVVKGTDERKQNALAAFDGLVALYRELGDHEAAGRVASEQAAFDREGFKKPLPPASKDKIDDAAFWRLLADASQNSSSLEEARVRLIESLERLDAAGIRKFHSLYARTMKRLYHWNVWALASAARGGCSDDAFHEFRSWMILQGDPPLIDLAIASPHEAARHVLRDPDMLEGGLTAAIEAAHLARTGTLPKALMTDLERPRGRIWDEDDLAERYPDLVAIYERAAPPER